MFNLRDIGGQAAAGGTVRRGRLLRSNALVELGEPGRRRISELGIVTAIDLREPGEREAEPSDLADMDVTLSEVALIDGLYEALTPDLFEFNAWMLRERGAQMVEVIRLLNAPAALPGVYFCSSGKDRTGLVTALILSALGVADEAIVLDYALSESQFPDWYRERAVERAIAGGMSDELLDDYRAYGLASPAPVMRATLDQIAGDHGGAARYLLAAGLGADELDELRGKLVRAA